MVLYIDLLLFLHYRIAFSAAFAAHCKIKFTAKQNDKQCKNNKNNKFEPRLPCCTINCLNITTTPLYISIYAIYYIHIIYIPILKTLRSRQLPVCFAFEKCLHRNYYKTYYKYVSGTIFQRSALSITDSNRQAALLRALFNRQPLPASLPPLKLTLYIHIYSIYITISGQLFFENRFYIFWRQFNVVTVTLYSFIPYIHTIYISIYTKPAHKFAISLCLYLCLSLAVYIDCFCVVSTRQRRHSRAAPAKYRTHSHGLPTSSAQFTSVQFSSVKVLCWFSTTDQNIIH